MKLRHLLISSLCLATLSPLAATAQDTFTFDNELTVSNFVTTTPPNPGPMTVGSTTITSFVPTSSGGNGLAFDFEDAAGYGTNESGVVLVNESTLPGDTLTLNFAHPITSFAMDYFVTGGFGGGPFTFSVAGTDYNNLLGDAQGIASPTLLAPVSSILLTFGGGTSFALDNITVTTAPVPEPGTVAFALALGLPAAWGVRKKLARK